jgi:hypothetical protein
VVAVEETVRLFLDQRMDRSGRPLSEHVPHAQKVDDCVRYQLMAPDRESLLRSRK